MIRLGRAGRTLIALSGVIALAGTTTPVTAANSGQATAGKGGSVSGTFPEVVMTPNKYSLKNARFVVKDLGEISTAGARAYSPLLSNDGLVLVRPVDDREWNSPPIGKHHMFQAGAELDLPDEFSERVNGMNSRGDIFAWDADTGYLWSRNDKGKWSKQRTAVLPGSMTMIIGDIRFNNEGRCVQFTWEPGAEYSGNDLAYRNVPVWGMANFGLPATPGYALNNNGVVAKAFAYRDNYEGDGCAWPLTMYAALWKEGQSLRPLPYWPNYAALPSAINDHEQVTGNMLARPYLSDSVEDFLWWYSSSSPVIWDGGTLRELEDPGESVTMSLNNHAQIVGMTHAGPLTLAGDEPWFPDEFLYGQGWSIGTGDGLSITPSTIRRFTAARAVLWENLQAIDLNTRVVDADGWILCAATKINDRGEIVGIGTRDKKLHWFLLYRPPHLAVDQNRDGQIKLLTEGDISDLTSSARPFRFWLNDDDDEWVTTTALGVVETETELDDKNITDVSKQNWRNNIIDNERDLEDFARIQLSLSGLSDAVKNGQLYLGLKWKNTTGTPAIKLYRATDPDGTTGYLTTPSAATRQALEVAIVDARYPGYAPDGRFVSDHTLIEGSDVFVIPSLQFINLSESKPRTNFLFEGCKAGTGQLAVVILKKETDGSFTTIGEGPGVWMDLKEPNQFIQRWTCGDGDRGAVSAVTLDPSKSGAFGAPSTDEEKDMVLYVHGYNMQEFEKQRWIETTYKRLWHLGYKGRVGGFTWPCAQSSVPFDQSEEKAWQAGTQLLALLNTLKSQGYRVHLIGHSQGNVVIGEALRQAGPNSAVATTYIASQAAVPAHCYDAAQPERSGSTAFTPDTPNIYSRFRTPNEDPYLPATWSTSDPAYLVQTQLQGSVGKFVNFFNPQDYALSGNGFSLLADDGSQPGWLADQRLKPDLGWGYNSTDGFVEVTGAAESPSVTRLTVALPAERYEIFAYCAEARSLALGASANMGGVFSGSGVNLTDAPFNFRNQHIYHSGQFRSFYAQRWQYWQQFLKSSDIDVRDTP